MQEQQVVDSFRI